MLSAFEMNAGLSLFCFSYICIDLSTTFWTLLRAIFNTELRTPKYHKLLCPSLLHLTPPLPFYSPSLEHVFCWRFCGRLKRWNQSLKKQTNSCQIELVSGNCPPIPDPPMWISVFNCISADSWRNVFSDVSQWNAWIICGPDPSSQLCMLLG